VAQDEQRTFGQGLILVASGLAAAMGILWIGDAFVIDGEFRFGNPVDASVLSGAGPDPQPRRIRAEVVSAEGSTGVRVGDGCNFLVERHPLEDGRFYCRAQVICGGVLLYGGPDRGYFACALYDEPRRDVVGSDPSTTGSDHDGALQLDSVSGVLKVWDDSYGEHNEFMVIAEITDVR
jgi:hypothetical protein